MGLNEKKPLRNPSSVLSFGPYVRIIHLRIRILFFNFHVVMKTVGGAKIP